MFTNIARRMTIGLGLALVVGSLIVANAGSARAQAHARPATQTVVAATSNQPGDHGMTGVASGQNGHKAPRHGQASAQYHGGSWHGGQGHGGPCW